MSDDLLALARATPAAVWVCPTADRVATVRRRLAAVPCLSPVVTTPNAVPAAAPLVILDGVSASDPRLAALLATAGDTRLSPPETHNPSWHRIEAAGSVGESRLVARQIRRLLLAGTSPSRVVLTGRGLDRSVWTSELSAHGVASAWAEPLPVAAHPAVRFLLTAWTLPADDFRFPALAAVLRSTWLHPNWPEYTSPDLPAACESLLRAVGVPRNRTAYLAAVAGWAETPPLPLEDETAEAGRRRRLHRLAGRCQPFLSRLFKLWNRRPDAGTPRLFVRELRRFAGDIGLSSQVERDPHLNDGWASYWAAMTDLTGDRVLAPEFDDRLRELAASILQPLPPQRGDAIRVLSPEAARHADCEHLVLANLREGAFPRPEVDPAAERELFAALLARPQIALVLSRPATDAGGEVLLPATALSDAVAGRDLAPPERQRMLLDGYADGEPHTAAELRVRAARAIERGDPLTDWPVTDELRQSLRAAHTMAVARHRDRQFNRFDGELRHPAVLADLRARFGTERVFSPTSLETYIACPFRFWLEHVLRLEPLNDPDEEVEHTRRGQAVHRALARLHTRPNPPTDVAASLKQELMTAVQEYADRAPSAVGRALWDIEGKRLSRLGDKYARHWGAFRAEWTKHRRSPGPHAVEADFGVTPAPGKEPLPPLVLAADTSDEVRIGGRIDRIDLATGGDEVGFWVIDYKTGRRTNYTHADVAAFKKVQLPLYALAVERVVFAGRPARPLGLAYWLVADGGCRTVLPRATTGWASDSAAWRAYADVLEGWVRTVVGRLRAGDFVLAPRSDRCTETCRFGPTCRIGQSRQTNKPLALPLPVVSTTTETE